MPLRAILADIATPEVDAVVTAVNSALVGGGEGAEMLTFHEKELAA